jgi:hypothetical protein
VQKAHNALLLKALLARAMRSLSVYIADIKASLEYLQGDLEDSQQSAVGPLVNFIKSTEGFITTLEEKSGKEFLDSKPSFDPKKSNASQLQRRVSKTLRKLSSWANKTAETLKAYSQVNQGFKSLSNDAYQTAMAFDDMLLPESKEEAQENLLLEEYRKLAGLLC